MKTKALKYLESLVTENTPKGECDLITYCKKCVRAYTDPDKKKEEFIPPTIEDVREHVREKGYNLDVQKFYEYYSESKWRDSRGKPVKNWKLKLLVWDRPKASYQNNKSKSKAWERNYDNGELNKLFVDISDVEL